MARRQQSGLEDLFHLFKLVPFWAGPVAAAFLFVLMYFGVPLLFRAPREGFDASALWGPVIRLLAWAVAIFILIAWVLAEIWKLRNRRMLDQQTGIASIRDLAWQDFERLVSEAYRRQGYLVEVVGNGSGDGGVDIRLGRSGEAVLVQCKQWRAFKVGVTTVRELLGVVVSARAHKGIVVTSGRFTREAREFAAQNPRIELVDGEALARLVAGVQIAPSGLHLGPAPLATPPCPSCGSTMVLRTARKGPNAGSQFWGCPKYPACRGIRSQ